MANISFIGAGNLAASLVQGLVERGFDAGALTVADADAAKAESLARKYPGVTVRASNREAAADCEALVACVKPGDMRSVCEEVGPVLQARSGLLVSVAAGVSCALVARWVRNPPPLVRCMPNTPVAVGLGMSVLYAGVGASRAHRDLAESVFAAVGDTAWIEDETLMDSVTAVSGSGPAYFFRVMEALVRGAVALGIDPAAARKLVVQTALGASMLAHRSADLKALREKVTSKGGTTECAVESLEQSGIDETFERALTSAARRSREISRRLDRDSGGD